MLLVGVMDAFHVQKFLMGYIGECAIEDMEGDEKVPLECYDEGLLQ